MLRFLVKMCQKDKMHVKPLFCATVNLYIDNSRPFPSVTDNEISIRGRFMNMDRL